MPPPNTTSVLGKRPNFEELVHAVTESGEILKLKRQTTPVYVDIGGRIQKFQRLSDRSGKSAVFRNQSPPQSGGDPKTYAKEYAKWLFPSDTSFYDVLRDLAERAREGDGSAIAEIKKIDALSKQNRDFKAEIGNRVRVKAKKPPGYLKGVGLDELFMTSKTVYFLKWAAGMVEGKQAESTVKYRNGKEETFTVLDLQEHFRLPTDAVLTMVGEAHIGGILNSSGRYLIKGQPGLHKDRQDAIERAKTPLEAAHAALRAHIKVTPKAKVIEKMHKKGIHVSGYDLSDPSDREAMHKQFFYERDALKAIAERYAKDFPPPQRLRSLSPAVSDNPPVDKFPTSAVPRLTDRFTGLARET